VRGGEVGRGGVKRGTDREEWGEGGEKRVGRGLRGYERV